MSHVLIFQPAQGDKPEALFGSREQVVAWTSQAARDGRFVDAEGEERTAFRWAAARILSTGKQGEVADA